MKLIHTSDWHLGHHLYEKNREQEHNRFLNWMIEELKTQKADVLIVAGDIFDTGFPPNYSLKQYYNFLRRLADTTCSNVIIIGGNHDSPSTLNAPREVLKFLNIYVVGGSENDLSDEVILVKDKSEEPLAIVCAVPYLRLRDTNKALIGETYEQKEEAYSQGIKKHYYDVALKAREIMEKTGLKLPVIATGHLFAAGSSIRVSESERDLYIGGHVKVGETSFHPDFNYVALGHMHEAQLVNKNEHMRFSGSPIPLSFGEAGRDKVMIKVEFNNSELESLSQITIPCFRKLLRFTGKLNDVITKIKSIDEKSCPIMQPWAEILLDEDKIIPADLNQINELAKIKNFEILKLKLNKKEKFLLETKEVFDLNELTPLEVFIKKCELTELTDEQKEILIRTYNELFLENNNFIKVNSEI